MSQEISNNKLYTVVIVLSIAVLLMAVIVFDRQPAGQKEEHILSISGSAEKTVAPDTASLSIGVVIQAPTAKEASDKNAVSMNATINELRNLGLQDKDIQTSFLSIQPVYKYNGAQTIEAYSASNNVQVTTKMLDKLSDIIDRSAAAGANQIGGVSFSVSEEKQKTLREELMTEAVSDASSKANDLAKKLDVRIVGVKTSSINEGGIVQPFLREVSMAEGKVATPIMPGETKVSLSVQVTYIIE
ncbi:MAG: SIMPL domain-containing protein [Candidatus Methanoperedens sp.]|nr:SIMPL domain-containing protein [Candidatus Methanoperedens sp.]